MVYRNQWQQFKTIPKNCGSYFLLEGKTNLNMRSVSPISDLGFQHSGVGLLWKNDRKSKILIFLVPILSSNFLQNSELKQVVTICECNCTHSLPCNGKKLFKVLVVRSADAALVLARCSQFIFPHEYKNFKTFSKLITIAKSKLFDGILTVTSVK